MVTVREVQRLAKGLAAGASLAWMFFFLEGEGREGEEKKEKNLSERGDGDEDDEEGRPRPSSASLLMGLEKLSLSDTFRRFSPLPPSTDR